MPTRKRIRTQNPGGGGAGPGPDPGDADIKWTDPIKYRDGLVLNPRLPDNVKYRDAVSLVNPKIGENLHLRDSRQVPEITATYPDPLKYREQGFGAITELICARSGTPDSDVTGDAWVDGVPLNNTVNHGNESPLPTSGVLLSATTQAPVFKWNLTTPKFVGLAHRSGIGGCTFSFWAQQALAVVQSLDVVVYTTDTNPWTESTVNFNNYASVTHTQRASRSISVLVGAVNGRYDVTLTPTEFAPCIGRWLVVIMTSAAVLATPINVVSREGAAGERPRLTFDFQIGT